MESAFNDAVARTNAIAMLDLQIMQYKYSINQCEINIAFCEGMNAEYRQHILLHQEYMQRIIARDLDDSLSAQAQIVSIRTDIDRRAFMFEENQKYIIRTYKDIREKSSALREAIASVETNERRIREILQYQKQRTRIVHRK